MALSRLRIEAQKERNEEEKKQREALAQTIGEASRLRQEAAKEKKVSLPAASEIKASAANNVRTGSAKKMLDDLKASRNASQKANSYLDAARNANTPTITTEASKISREDKERRRNELKAELEELSRQANLNKKKQVGYMRGNVGNLLREAEAEGAKINSRISELNEELKRIDLPDTISYNDQLSDELEAALERQKRANNAVARYSGEAGGRALAAVPKEQREALYKELNEANAAVEALKRKSGQIEYLNKYQDKTYADNFTGQFGANYSLGRISQDANAAFSKYLSNPTEANRDYAFALQELEQAFQSNNQNALDDDGWVRKTAANYLPQLVDNTTAWAGGALAGGAVGTLVGNPIMGARLGSSAATAAQSYSQMQGAAFRTMLAAGMDEDAAREAAQDEGFVAAVIEFGLNYATWGLSGAGDLIGAAGNAAVKNGSKNAAVKFISNQFGKSVTDKMAKQAAKSVGKSVGRKVLETGGKVVLDASGEYLEEAAQQAVSIANQNRDGTGKWDLAKEAAGVTWDAITGKNEQARAEMHEAGTEGFKIGLMFGGVQTTVNTTIAAYTNAKTLEERKAVVKSVLEDKESLDALIQEGKETGNEAAKIAGEIEGKSLRDEAITEKDVERLIAANDVYIEAEVKKAAKEAARNAQDGASLAEGKDATPVTKSIESEVSKATGYGQHGTSSFIGIVEATGADPGKVRMEFQSAYEAGRVGLSQQVARLDSDVRLEAYNAGRLDAIMDQGKAKDRAKNAVVRKDAGFDRANLPTDVTETQYKAVDMLARATGVRVQIAKGLKGNAEIRDDGTVLIAEDFQREVRGKKRSIVFYAVHEIGMHRLMQLAPEAGQAFINAVIRDANAGLAYGQTTVTEKRQATYAAQNVHLTTGKAMEEVAADSVYDLYDDENLLISALDRVINGKDEKAKQGARKFKEILDDIVKKLKRAIAKLTGKEKTEAKQTLTEVEQLRDLFEKGLKAATNKAANDTGRAAKSDGTMDYSLKEATEYGREQAISHSGNVKGEREAGKYDAGGARSRAERYERRIAETCKAILADETRPAGNRHDRKETLESFKRRARANGLRNYENPNGTRAFAVKPAKTWNKNADDVRKTLSGWGFNVVVFDGELLTYKDGISESCVDAQTLRANGQTILFVASDIAIDGLETAYHEAFHIAKAEGKAAWRKEVEQIIVDAADVDSDAFELFIREVAEPYDYTVKDVSVEDFARIITEESYAWYIGRAYVKDGRYMRMLMEAFSDVESAKKKLDAAYDTLSSGTDTQYSLKDSQGRELSKGQQEYFKNSKVRDENGNLKVMYHGSEDAGFHVFNPRFSDDGISLFFSDSNTVAKGYSGTHETYAPKAFASTKELNKFLTEIGQEDYEVVRRGDKFTLYYDADEEIITADTLGEIYDEFLDYSGLGQGSANYKVYLNIKKPLVVDAQNNRWDELSNWASAAFIQDEDVEVKRVGDEFRLIDKSTKADVPDASIAVNSYNETLDQDILRTVLVNKANSIIAIKTENLRTTRDVSKWAKGRGYDGVIFKNIIDSGLYASGMERFAPATVAIAFAPDQVKSVENLNPTEDEDIRFSLKSPVEETETLVALHNTFEHKLRSTLKLGAWPSPSIAIVEAAQGHTGYGEYSVVFPRSTIDPEVDYRNKVYGSDAWTPTGDNARVEYQVDYDVKREFEQNMALLAEGVAGGIFSRSGVLGMMGIDDESSMTLEEIAHRLATRYDTVRAAYLGNKGGDIDVVYRTKEFDSAGNEALKQYIDRLGEQEVARLAAKMLTGERLSAEEIETAKDSIVEHWVAQNEWRLKKKPELREKRIANRREMLTDLRVEDFVRHAWEFYEDSGATTDEVNQMETAENLRHAVNDADVEAWVLDMLHGLLGEPGIYNGRETMDAAGNRRDFWETHWSYTVENIVKAMNAASARGEGMMGTVGATGLLAKATPEYRSVAEIRADKGRLGKIDNAEYERLMQELDAELDAVVAEIMRNTEHHADNRYDEESIVQYVIGEAATGKTTIDAIVKTFKAEDYKISTATAKKIQALFRKAEKIPTGYFEAKPQRVVAFDEAVAVLAPSGAPADLLKQMRDVGINVIEYQAGNDAQRLEILNGLEGTKFSLREDENLMRENAKLKEVNQELREQFKTTQFAKVDKKALRDFAKSLLKDYSSGADIDETRDALDDLYTYLANGEDGMSPDWNEAYKRAYETAVGILEASSTLDDEMYQTYKDLRQRLRSVGISISPEYGSDLMGYENLQDFRKRNFGRLNIVKNGTPVDALYAELANAYPELFDEDTYNNQGDQLVHIAEVLDSMQPMEVNPYSHNMRENATWLANDIMERFFDLPQAKPTFADKAEQKLTKQAIKDAKKLERVREQKNERIKQLIEDNREKVRQTQAKERTKREEAVQKVKAHYKAKESKASESRKAQEMRAKILRHTTQLSKKLLRASDKNHIPQELQGVVAKLLECINLESNYTYDPQSDGYKKNDMGSPTMRTKLARALQKVYGDMANELTIDPDLLGDDGLLAEVIGMADTRLVDMTLPELETVWKTIRAIEASVQSANIAFNQSRWATISEAAEALRMDNFSKKEKVEMDGPGGVLGKAQKLTGLDMMTPEAYFHRLGKSGDGLFRMMRDAQDDHIRKMKEVSDFTHEALKGVNVRKLENQMHTVKLGGKDVQMSTAQIMEMYVLMRREQARDHIMVGGILPDVVSKGGIKKVSRAKPVRGVQFEEMAKAFKLLTDEQIRIAEKLQEYASTELSKWGNEAAMKVYNYEKFGEKTYWPIRVNRQETPSNVQKDTQVTSVAGRGFTKGTKPHANNSVMIGSIFDTFSTHASEMATYAAWLAPMEDINRIRNFTFKSEGQTVDTVKGIIDTVHGKAGTAYLSKLLADLSNGVKGTHGETAYMSGLVGNYKAASVGANLRVIIQQPTSLLRALDMLGPQHMVAGMRPVNGWKKALKYAPIAQWKDWGYFDINTGRQMKDVLFDSDSVLNKVKNASMWGAGKADSLSWGLLWNAVEAETKHKRKDLKAGTEQFYETVAERFAEIVDHTQVVDGILQRSQIMRSADGLTKMATSFMGEPTKQYNMMLSAAYDATHGSKEQRDAGKKRFARTAVALTISGVVNAMAQAIMDAVRDDDKEKDYWDKWLAAFTGLTGEEETLGEAAKNAVLEGNLGSTFNPAGYIPYVKDIVSIIQGYDVSRMDMESIEKTLSAAQNMVKALNGEGKYTIGSAAASLFAEVARMVGVPVANLKREVKSFAMLAATETDNYLMQYRMEKAALALNYSGNSGTFLNILFNAYQNDQEAYEIIYKDMIASGYDPEKLANGMESRMMKAEGVDKVGDLEHRFLHPNQRTEWNRTMSVIGKSGLWKNANEEHRDALESDLYNLVTDSKAGQGMQEKIKEGASYGLDETEYLLYRLALDMYDTPNKSGELGGTPTSEEKATAIAALGNLNNGEIACLWDTEQGYELYENGIDMQSYVDYVGAGGSVNAEKLLDVVGKGIEEETYYDFLDMLKKVDQPTESGKMGSYTQDEARAAVKAIPGLTRAERAALWQSVNKGWKAKNNPWR